MFDASPITIVEPVAEPAPKRRGRPRLEGRERFPGGQVRPAAQAPQQSAPELGKPSAKRLSADEIRRAGSAFVERILATSFAERPGGVGYFDHQEGMCCWPPNGATPVRDHRVCGAAATSGSYCAEHGQLAFWTPAHPAYGRR
jgi:hypothetical protein